MPYFHTVDIKACYFQEQSLVKASSSRSKYCMTRHKVLAINLLYNVSWISGAPSVCTRSHPCFSHQTATSHGHGRGHRWIFSKVNRQITTGRPTRHTRWLPTTAWPGRLRPRHGCSKKWNRACHVGSNTIESGISSQYVSNCSGRYSAVTGYSHPGSSNITGQESRLWHRWRCSQSSTSTIWNQWEISHWERFGSIRILQCSKGQLTETTL